MYSLNTKYIDRLDHLRFFAAILLIFHHFRGNVNWNGHLQLESIIPLWLQNGSTGVSFFLVLTGFLFCQISNGGQENLKYWGFIYNRVLRIFPLMIFLVFIIICCSRQTSTPMDILRIITLQLNTGNSLTGWGHDFYPSGPIWTIAVEFQFYLFFPFLSLFLNRYGIKYLVALVILMIATRFNIAILKGGDIYYNVYHSIIGRLDQFIIGMILGYYYQKGIFRFLEKWKYQLCFLSTTILIFTYLFKFKKLNVIYTSLSFTIEAVLWGIITLCYIYIRLPKINKLNTILSYLGMCSFSMYLLHLPIGIMLNKLIGWQVPQDVFTSLSQSIIICILTILVSLFTFNLIEKPFMKMRIKYTKE
ncbi:Peptidoglycan/LPS O-acetylase OafA/YrhL, contains acyltransferase and SGNH-hydrolase domains [Gilliamella bombicola]|uniref:Peptidoglycan/LPS O-acetylase OafA/YrhL, contains acyltransferase and SGNH-hydrolase domains n=1 Tax=Gilliamella bombicola TaxID=1798182 RepID=A0A1C4ASH6_9GAMM|nr:MULTISPECIES: acyltransferase [Gilliamella]NUF26573.1 acyltransferase [Gilliamella sp. ESL0254]SCB97514.1 Peptidoglycan/LPS O-acetylase OafA/YrhL, contains acyltransferase and SGNH-hydrolase domains [Gilliamella bombicola]